MELINHDLNSIMLNYPKFELSYETVSQKGDLMQYDACVVIPTGKKAFIWNTFHKTHDITYLMEINRNKQIAKAVILDKRDIQPLCHNSIVYGTIIESEEQTISYFVIEDIHYYNGMCMKNTPFATKLSYIKDYILTIQPSISNFTFAIPYMWSCQYNNSSIELPFIIENTIQEKLGYVPHHLQYRSKQYILPYINVLINRKLNLTSAPNLAGINTANRHNISRYTIDFFRPQYKYNTVFQVKADMQNDIYHLFAFGNKKLLVYYGIMYIADYKTSVMMNSLFRNIKENKNIDYIEESDDEEDFQNTSLEKYVDLQKVISFECKFHRKFKKWAPVVPSPPNTKIIHISKLVTDYYA
jgi:hypothetical protein